MPRKRSVYPLVCACGESAWMRVAPTQVVVIDAEDISLLESEPWHANPKGYVYGKRSGRRLHRAILGVEDPEVWVDHESTNKMDCRRGNLRPCNLTQSIHNRKKLKSPRGETYSPYKGVTAQGGGWVARIGVDGVRLYLGTFADEVRAALAYDAAARVHHGEFALTNF